MIVDKIASDATTTHASRADISAFRLRRTIAAVALS
jgi:hypothetical protein